MSAICDAHQKKVGVELLYNSVHRKFNQFGDQTSWRQDAVEKASTQQREPSSPRLISWGSDELENWWCRENSTQQKAGPPGLRLSNSVERERHCYVRRSWGGQYVAVCVQSPTPHTQHFQIKWDVYFSKNCVARLYLWFCMHMEMYMYYVFV